MAVALVVAAITELEYEAVTVATQTGTGVDRIVFNVNKNSEGKGRKIHDCDEGLLAVLLLGVTVNKKWQRSGYILRSMRMIGRWKGRTKKHWPVNDPSFKLLLSLTNYGPPYVLRVNNYEGGLGSRGKMKDISPFSFTT